ncbi:MAG: transposase [Phycisphaerales bacterium]
MLEQTVDQLQFDFLPQKPIVARSRPQPVRSDAGSLPIRRFDDRWRYTRRLAGCLVDRRCDPDHSQVEMVRRRLYGMLAGYEDCNDHDTLRSEPVFKLVAGRRIDDDPPASQFRGRRSVASRTASRARSCNGWTGWQSVVGLAAPYGVNNFIHERRDDCGLLRHHRHIQRHFMPLRPFVNGHRIGFDV